MQMVSLRVLMATLAKVQRHRISLRPHDVLQSPWSHMFSQYLCGTETPDSAHTIHEVQIQDRHGEMEHVRAPSVKNHSVRAEWLHQSGLSPAEPSATPGWPTTPNPAPKRRVELHIALRSQFRRVFLLCR